MIVDLPRKLLKGFKEQSKEIFPLESYGILLGKVSSRGDYRVTHLYVPPDSPFYATDDSIMPQDQWFRDARALARDCKVSVLGDIHSHTWPKPWKPDLTCQPSAADLKRYDFLRKKTRIKSPIFGIFCIFPSKRGMEHRLEFWPIYKLMETRLL